jgi:hypothetical protein
LAPSHPLDRGIGDIRRLSRARKGLCINPSPHPPTLRESIKVPSSHLNQIVERGSQLIRDRTARNVLLLVTGPTLNAGVSCQRQFFRRPAPICRARHNSLRPEVSMNQYVSLPWKNARPASRHTDCRPPVPIPSPMAAHPLKISSEDSTAVRLTRCAAQPPMANWPCTVGWSA